MLRVTLVPRNPLVVFYWRQLEFFMTVLIFRSNYIFPKWSDWNGYDCSIPICLGLNTSDPLVRNRNGTCIDADTCECIPGFASSDQCNWFWKKSVRRSNLFRTWRLNISQTHFSVGQVTTVTIASLLLD